jgi:hypothetical protein
MTSITIASYTDHDGVAHDVQVQLATGGAWTVLDVSKERTVLVERLVDTDNGEAAAGVAFDYVEQIELYLAGSREEHTVPNPLPRPEILTTAPVRRSSRRTNREAPAGQQDLPLAA